MLLKEKLKAKIDNLSMILNHIFVVIVGFGAWGFSKLTTGSISYWVYLDFLAIIGFIILYVYLLRKKRKLIEELSNG